MLRSGTWYGEKFQRKKCQHQCQLRYRRLALLKANRDQSHIQPQGCEGFVWRSRLQSMPVSADRKTATDSLVHPVAPDNLQNNSHRKIFHRLCRQSLNRISRDPKEEQNYLDFLSQHF